MRGVFLTAEWKNLAVITYAIDSSVLQPYLPVGLRLDEWEGQALVSLLGFQFLNTNILGLSIPFWGSFPEVNLRFYVRRNTPEGERRGVVFIKEIVPYAPVAAVARNVYNENYHHMPMTHAADAAGADYRWQFAGRENRLAVVAKGLPTLPDDDSLETFVIEHRWGYSRSREGGCIEYEVDRRPWRTCAAGTFEVDVDVAGLYGVEFQDAFSRPPISVVLAEGSRVAVRFGQRIA